jgi:hypothetical protein
MASVFRRVAAVFGVATLLAGLALPPVHVHLGEDADAHEPVQGIVHAHWSAHAGVDGNVDLTEGDGPVLFLDQRATASVSDHATRSLPVAVAVEPAVVANIISTRALAATEAATRDGPLRRLSAPRAPPVVA